MNVIAVVLLLGALFSSESLLSVQGAWRNLVPGRAIWKDSGNRWSAFVPGNSDIWHFGPTRLWTTPINTDHYEITSRVLTATTKVNGDCGHMFKYKVGSSRTRNFVKKAWGYFMWARQYLYITSNGKENSPQIKYKYSPNQWYDLKTVVQGAVVKIYINNVLQQQITMTGEGATSKTNNFVGLWCHSNTNDTGSDFRVKILSGGNHKQVNCTSNHMQIAIPKSSLPYVLGEDLRLNDPSCGPTEDQKNFYFKTAFDQCGTKATSTSSVITYANKIQGRQVMGNNTVISRIPRNINITFSCSYPRTNILSSSNVQPNNSNYIAAFHSNGQLHFSLKLFPTDQFNTPYSKYPISLHLRQLVYVEVSVRSLRNELSILLKQCYATPTSDGVTPKHWLIKDSCPVDRTLKPLPSPTTNVQRFRLQAFRFVGNPNRNFFIHCLVVACNGNDVNSTCARGCKQKQLRKRSDEVHSFKVIQGPITVREPEVDDVEFHDDQTFFST